MRHAIACPTKMNLIGRPVSRREILKSISCGFGYLAFAGLCAHTHGAAVNPMTARPAIIPARAKRVIFLFMQGGPSHVDTYDPKPLLDQNDGKEIEFRVARTRTVTARKILKSPWKFKQYGQCGRWVSELFPEVA